MTSFRHGNIKISTLCYHSFSNTTTDALRELTVDPSLFSEQIAALRDSGCRFIRFQDIPMVLSGSTIPEGPGSGPIVAITIDDGFADVTTGALPALSDYEAVATLFVPTAYVGGSASWLPADDGDRPICDWQSLDDLCASGWEVASHGHLHIAADISAPEAVKADAQRSRGLLEDHLGQAVTSFAYPFGYYSKQGIQAVRNAGFDLAGIVSGATDRSNDDPWRLPRALIGPRLSPEDLVTLIHRRGGDARWRNRTKQQLWLLGRRRFSIGPPEAAPIDGIPDDGLTDDIAVGVNALSGAEVEGV
jgi:peptidoglycan/xylan/chitin deacetylase (PgdA/CDA1 family)